MQERVYHTLSQDVADPRQKAMSSSAGFQLNVVDEAISGVKDSTPVFTLKEVTSNSALT